MAQRRTRIYHAPFDVGGNAYYLSRAERARGYDSKSFVYFKQWFGYPVDRDLKVGAGGNPFRSWRWWLGMAEILLRADVVHFNFGTSLLSDLNRNWIMADLPLLQALGIATFATFQGCDSRISDYAIANFETNACLNCRSRPVCEGGYNDYKREMIHAARARLDGIYAVNPDILHNINEARFLPYSNCDTDDWVPVPPASNRTTVRVLHAPTWREIKGSDYILAALEELKQEGEDIEILLVENVPHAEVRKLYELADLLVDQVLVGWYGGLAVELMALGKPVVAYLRDGDLAFIPDEMRKELPVVSASPRTLKETLRTLVRDRERLGELGRASRAFVEKWHAPASVATITSAAYDQAVVARGGHANTWTRITRLWSFFRQHGKFSLDTYTATWGNQAYEWARKTGPTLTASFAVLSAPLIWLASFWRLNVLAKPSSIWGTTPILTLPLLANSDQSIGLRSETMTYTVYYITKDFDHIFKGTIDWLAPRAAWLIPIFRRLVLMWALIRFDVFHFFCDEGILERDGRFGVSTNEMTWIRRFGKRLYLYAYGADVRTRAETEKLGKFNCCTNCDKPGVHCLCDSETGARNMAQFGRFATQLVSIGDMMTYTPGARPLWYWPVDLEKLTYAGVAPVVDRPLRIFHAPNHGWAKGSHYLKAAIAKLRAEGVAIELDTVSGVSNEVVISRMSECDVVVDQLLIGWHGYTALEAMARGKPVICYIRDRSMLIDGETCTIISATPDTIEMTLRDLVHRPREELVSMGEASRNYVERYYSIEAVGQRLGQMYLDTAGFSRRVNGRIRDRINTIRSTNR